VFVVCNANH